MDTITELRIGQIINVVGENLKRQSAVVMSKDTDHTYTVENCSTKKRMIIIV